METALAALAASNSRLGYATPNGSCWRTLSGPREVNRVHQVTRSLVLTPLASVGKQEVMSADWRRRRRRKAPASPPFLPVGFIFLCIFVNLHVCFLLFPAAVCVLEIKVQRCR